MTTPNVTWLPEPPKRLMTHHKRKCSPAGSSSTRVFVFRCFWAAKQREPPETLFVHSTRETRCHNNGSLSLTLGYEMQDSFICKYVKKKTKKKTFKLTFWGILGRVWTSGREPTSKQENKNRYLVLWSASWGIIWWNLLNRTAHFYWSVVDTCRNVSLRWPLTSENESVITVRWTPGRVP